MSVDLPGPVWPSSPWISPGRTSRSTSSSALRPPPKSLDRWRSEMTASDWSMLISVPWPRGGRGPPRVRCGLVAAVDSPELRELGLVRRVAVPLARLLGRRRQLQVVDVVRGEHANRDQLVLQRLLAGHEAHRLVGGRPALVRVVAADVDADHVALGHVLHRVEVRIEGGDLDLVGLAG